MIVEKTQPGPHITRGRLMLLISKLARKIAKFGLTILQIVFSVSKCDTGVE